MNAADFCDPGVQPLRDTDSVADAVREALQGSARDIAVTDAKGTFVGMFRIDRLLTSLLPQGALMGRGVPDLGFVHPTKDELRRKLEDIEKHLVRNYLTQPDQILRPLTSALEAILLLHRGAPSLPIVDDQGKLVGVIGPRDVLRTLDSGGGV